MNKRGKRVEWVRSSAGIFLMLMLLGGIVFYVFTIPPADREAFLEGVENKSISLLDVSPGEISKTEQEFEKETISLNNIVVDNSKHILQELVSSQFVLTSDMFQNTVADFTFDADKDTLRSARLQFYIYSKEGNGVLNVKLNGYKIFSSTVEVGNKVVVNLPLNRIMHGSNKVEIYISPGFSTKRYTIIDARLISEDYAPEQATVSQSFTLPSYDEEGVRDVKLNAYIIQQAEPKNLGVKLNGNLIYSGIPSTNLEILLSNNQINSGINTLEWEVNEDGKYQIKFIRLSYKSLEIKGREESFYFDIGSNNWDRVQSDSYDCKLYVERKSGTNEFTATINGDVNKYNFGNSNEFSTDICNRLTEGLNEIKISAEDDLNVKQLQIKVEI